jgi:hypothetical protein
LNNEPPHLCVNYNVNIPLTQQAILDYESPLSDEDITDKDIDIEDIVRKRIEALIKTKGGDSPRQDGGETSYRDEGRINPPPHNSGNINSETPYMGKDGNRDQHDTRNPAGPMEGSTAGTNPEDQGMVVAPNQYPSRVIDEEIRTTIINHINAGLKIRDQRNKGVDIEIERTIHLSGTLVIKTNSAITKNG